MHVRREAHDFHRFFQLQLFLQSDVFDDVDDIVKESDQEKRWNRKLQDESDDVVDKCWKRKTLDKKVWNFTRFHVRCRFYNDLSFNCVLEGDESLL